MKPLIVMAAAGSLLLGAAPPDDEVKVGGSQRGRSAGVVLEHSKITISGDTKNGRTDGYQMRSPCWYEPDANAEEMFKRKSDARNNLGWAQKDEEGFLEFVEQFKEKLGQPGMWWTPSYNSGDPKGAACWAGLEQFVFVPPGETPPSGVTIQELAEIARAALTVPEGKVQLNPAAKSYVNLPTFVWLEGIGDTTRSVTATLPGVMSATVTATLRDIKIDAGTGSDRAEVREDGCGTSGRPYARGADFTCGVRYLRASIDQPREVYELTVTSVWQVAVTGADIQFDPIQVEASADVPVGEVQSNVRP
ncbi:MAG TPA: hypothetical protein VKZ82_04020 [Nonomuraea sp.]|nr:hypothetical protein [Nonomuraea sp.]